MPRSPRSGRAPLEDTAADGFLGELAEPAFDQDLPLSIRHDQSGARSAHEHALLRIPTYLRDTILGPVSQGSFDTLSESSLAAVETLRIDAMQDFDGVASPLGDVSRGYSPIQPCAHRSVPQVVRRLYQWDAATSGANTVPRARCQARTIVSLGNSCPFRSPTNSRPSDPVPNVAMCLCNRTVNSGGHEPAAPRPTRAA